MPKIKIEVEYLVRAVEHCNELLASPIPQSAKRDICTMVESLLMGSDTYQGFDNIYWSRQGCNEWYEAGQPDFPEKNKYIIGPEGDKNKPGFEKINGQNVFVCPDFVSADQGEYARFYLYGKLKN